MKFPKRLTVAFYNYSNIFEYYNDTENGIRIEGVEARLLETLSQALGFDVSLVTPEDKHWASVQKNGLWDGLIGEITNGRADMAVGLTWITEERRRFVDFSVPYYYDEVTFSTRLPGPLPKTFIYVSPFGASTWIGILIVWFCLPAIFLALSKTKRHYLDLLFQLYASFLRQPMADVLFGSRFLLVSWKTFALVMSLSYAAVLSSFLTLQLRETPVRNFVELSDAVSNGYYRIVTRASVVEDLLNSEKAHVKRMGKMIVEKNWIAKAGSSGSAAENSDPNQVNLYSRSVLHFLHGKPPLSSRFISEDALFPVRCGVAMRKDFCCKHAVDDVIVRLTRAGIYNKLMDDQLFKKWLEMGKSIASRMDSEGRGIAVSDISGALILLLTGYALSLVTVVVEICFARVLNQIRIRKKITNNNR